jgi:predicted Zn-dependent protease
LPDFRALDPDKFFQQLFGAGGELNDDARLAKVEVSWEEELRLGQQTFEEFKQRLAAKKETLAERGRDVEYLQKLAGLIRPQMQQAARYRQLKVYVTSWKSPEAMVCPGGKLIVTQGLLDSAGCEAALVGVLGHELAHLDRGHLLRRMKQWKLAQQQFQQPAAGFSPDKLLGTMSTMQQLFRRPFGPAEELDADTDGITWTWRAGYDPRALTEVYAAFEKHGFNQPDFLPAFLRTHPPSAERRENLAATFQKLQAAGAKEKLYLGRENLARRLTRQQRDFAD